MSQAGEIVARLGLSPHPEGGWYRETWRASPPAGETRGRASAILFLLEAGQRSHWHRVDAAELWLHQAGARLLLRTARDGEGQAGWGTTVLGPDVLAGDTPQHLVEPGEWQSAESLGEWSLCACVVSPAFEFAGFELAPPGWSP